MQQATKQFLKQSSKIFRPYSKQTLFTVNKVVNRELFAKQAFSSKMIRFYNNTNSLTQKIKYQFSYPEHTKLTMPALSPTMLKGNIQKWNYKEGDKLDVGDVLCEVETDKSTVGFEVQEELYIAKILVQEGQETSVGSIVAIAVENEEDIKAFADYKLEETQAPAAEPEKKVEPTPSPKEEAPKEVQQPKQEQPKPAAVQPPAQQPKQQQQTQQQQSSQPVMKKSANHQFNGRILASPMAKKIALEKGIPLRQIQGTGLNGRITEQDVLSYQPPPVQQIIVQQAAPVDAKPQKEKKPDLQFSDVPLHENPFTDIPNSTMRKTIAKRLQESKQTVPHFYLSIDCNVDKVLEIRKQLNAIQDTKISINDFVIKASGLALRDFPEANAQWFDDKIRLYKNADISVAVSTDGGLITPIVFEANNKGLSEISKEVKSLAKKARANKLQPHEFIGGTFTISNLGMYGIDHFLAIANPPQACILAVSQSNKKMVYDASKADQEIPFSVSEIMNVTLSCDHRAVDGAVGASFLQKFKFYIENPSHMLL